MSYFCLDASSHKRDIFYWSVIGDPNTWPKVSYIELTPDVRLEILEQIWAISEGLA